MNTTPKPQHENQGQGQGSASGQTQPGGPSALHAPWRMSYMHMLSAQEQQKKHATEEDKPQPASAGSSPHSASANPNACFLRQYWLDPAADEQNHVIVRTGTEDLTSPDSPDHAGGMVLLNAYPYANGHLLVALGEGRPRLLDYSPAQRAQLWSLVDLAVELCEAALPCQGVNVGINQGLAAGAGVPEHLHVHVVPRWMGDVNFISTVASVRVIPSSIEDMARAYRDAWNAIRPDTTT